MPIDTQPPFPAPLFVNLEQASTPAAATELALLQWDGVEIKKKRRKELRLANAFLYGYRGSMDTFNGYRKQLEKLFLWSWVVCNKRVLKLTGEDIEAFVEFAVSPPNNWIAPARLHKYTTEGVNPRWRPFTSTGQQYKLSRSGVNSMFAAISSFYRYAVEAGDIKYNPVNSVRQKSKYSTSQQNAMVRRFENSDVDIMFSICDEKCGEDAPKWERARWCLHLLLRMYLRLSEVVESERHRPMQSDIYATREGIYQARIIGKGNKERLVTVPESVLDALARYREHLGFPGMPSKGDEIPMVPKLSNPKESIGSTRQLRRIMTEIFEEAASVVRERYGKDEADAFSQGTVHWLRHTGISEDVKYRPRDHVKQEAGHNSILTTEKYVDSTRREVAASREKSEGRVFTE